MISRPRNRITPLSLSTIRTTRLCGGRLAAAGLAYERHHLARGDRERHALDGVHRLLRQAGDGPHHAARHRVASDEPVDLEQALRARAALTQCCSRSTGSSLATRCRAAWWGSSPAGPRRRCTPSRALSFTIAPGEMVALVGESGCARRPPHRRSSVWSKRERVIRFPRPRDHAALPTGAATAAARDPDDLPGPLRVARPALHRPRHDRRAAARPPDRPRQGGARGQGTRRAGAGRADAARALHRPLSARALGRAASARRDRRQPGARSQAAGRRRAGVDAGRLGAGGHPVAPGRAPEGWDGHPDDHPRPVDGRALRRPDRRHVPGQDRRGRPGAGGGPKPAASVHESALISVVPKRDPNEQIDPADPHG